MEEVYETDLSTKTKKQALFVKLKMAITDIILACERKVGSNLDINLTNMIFNTEAISEVVKNNEIRAVYFSSRFAEKLFKKHFKELVGDYPKIELITLPSPSPRYAAMSKSKKIEQYKELLPKIK